MERAGRAPGEIGVRFLFTAEAAESLNSRCHPLLRQEAAGKRPLMHVQELQRSGEAPGVELGFGA